MRQWDADRRDGADQDFGIGSDIERAYNDFWWDYGNSITEDRRTSLIVDPPDGKIPWTPEGKARPGTFDLAFSGIITAGPEDRALSERCILGFNSGPPMESSAYNNNVQLFQTPDTVVIFNEMIHDARIVPLDGRAHLDTGHPPVDGRPARALGRRHAGGRNHQLPARDPLPGLERQPAPGGAVHAA